MVKEIIISTLITGAIVFAVILGIGLIFFGGINAAFSLAVFSVSTAFGLVILMTGIIKLSVIIAKNITKKK